MERELRVDLSLEFRDKLGWTDIVGRVWIDKSTFLLWRKVFQITYG